MTTRKKPAAKVKRSEVEPLRWEVLSDAALKRLPKHQLVTLVQFANRFIAACDVRWQQDIDSYEAEIRALQVEPMTRQKDSDGKRLSAERLAGIIAGLTHQKQLETWEVLAGRELLGHIAAVEAECQQAHDRNEELLNENMRLRGDRERLALDVKEYSAVSAKFAGAILSATEHLKCVDAEDDDAAEAFGVLEDALKEPT